ncbi:MAG: UPF0182 family protein [Spirulina sp. SIO3F2]|nr:UPF0182 family protein [Spirulina sp. SIO3F2]
MLLGLAIVLGLIGLASPIIRGVTELWWYQSVDQPDVFWTLLWAQSLCWIGTFVVFALVIWGNYWLANQITRYAAFRIKTTAYRDALPIEAVANGAAIAASVFLALGAAGSFASFWEVVLQFLHRQPVGVTDPIFQQDIGFYLFSLPFYQQVKNWLLTLLFSCLLVTIPVYVLKGSIDPGRGWRNLMLGNVKFHVLGLLAAVSFLVAWGSWLDRYEVLYSPDGVVFGAGYTDVHSRLFALLALSVVGAIVGISLLLSLRSNNTLFPLWCVGAYVIFGVVLQGVVPTLEQQLVVAPNELAKETEYINHSINFTRRAYGLDQITSQPYPVENKLDRATLDANPTTVDNIRLWDYRPMLSTYRQRQEIRLYYRFQDVDIDRYPIAGETRQVMLSARELDYSQVPERAKTWVNQRLKYTHGYGAVMSPVNQVTPEGQPELWIQDIPPKSSVDLEIEEPRIYYGEATNNYIFTGTSTDEFDYPLGQNNASNRYGGQGGVPMPTAFNRLLYALDRGSLKILISNYFTPESRIHYHREILDRVSRVAPFLELDQDPYLTVIEGRLQWIIDGYTISDRYPYSEPAPPGFNYIRNSVKVLVDAYDGTMQFFVVDPDDPLLRVYQQIFPSVFANAPEIPDQVRAHFRYPSGLFSIQALMYREYHMTNPEVFYNQEDLWRFPKQLYEDQEEVMQPYYVIMRLPDSEQEEFLLILPFTPGNKDNMVAWLAARCDGENYGTALLYEFPKQELIYGPKQIEARIDQTPSISQQLTLWSQKGSKVIRGDLLIIPIENSLLYVEPIYLRAEQGELPELQRVIVAYDEQIVMAETLDEALIEVFGQATTQRPRPTQSSPVATGDGSEPPAQPNLNNLSPLAQQALDLYQQSQAALKAGQWAEYGRLTMQLEAVLLELNGEAE